MQGIGVCAGLEVIPVAGITGNYHTDFAAKGRAAVEALRSGFDFLYIHVEAPDECGHHGEAKEKIWSIEQIDEKIILPVLEYLRESGEAFSALCMPDHPTPLAKLTHTPTPVPYALYRSGCERRERSPLHRSGGRKNRRVHKGSLYAHAAVAGGMTISLPLHKEGSLVFRAP